MGGKGILSLLLALFGVFLVLYLCYIFSKYVAKGMNKLGSAKYIDVVDRMVLGQEKSLAIIEIGARYYLISITSQSIQLVKELDANDLVQKEKIDNDNSIFNVEDFKEILAQNIKKNKMNKTKGKIDE